jgi:hypothetical protein
MKKHFEVGERVFVFGYIRKHGERHCLMAHGFYAVVNELLNYGIVEILVPGIEDEQYICHVKQLRRIKKK